MHSVFYTLSFGAVSTSQYVKKTKMMRSGAIEESMHRIGALDTLMEEVQRRLGDLDRRFKRFVVTNKVNTETTKETMKATKQNMEARFRSPESTLNSSFPRYKIFHSNQLLWSQVELIRII